MNADRPKETRSTKVRVANVLRQALKRMGPRGGFWTQGCGSRDVNGKEVDTGSDRVYRCCGYGAIWTVVSWNSRTSTLAEEALDNACTGHYPTFNDEPGRKFSEIRDVFNKAIAALEQK